ncbi:hypothetical protein STW0522CIT19_26060 [Citrobacter freundii]|nr:hypothetical protein STW0522CIT01_26070 [Citrobacter freundii]BBV36131.1 hypothetical protein STW0522CIT19_26060 [Citrobacter freundii]
MARSRILLPYRRKEKGLRELLRHPSHHNANVAIFDAYKKHMALLCALLIPGRHSQGQILLTWTNFSSDANTINLS